MKTIKQQIEQNKKELLMLETKLENENLKTFKCKKLNLEIAPLKEWTKSYNKIIIPKGWRLLKIYEFAYLIEEGYKKELIGKFINEYNHIWLQQTKYAKDNNYSFGAYLGDDGNWYASDDGLPSSVDYGRVAFCRELNVKNVKGDLQ